MSNLQTIADRIEIEALCEEFTDAGMMRDYERFASLFTENGVWRILDINAEFVSRGEIRIGIEQLLSGWDYFVQTPYPDTIQIENDTAVGHAYVSALGHLRNGSSQVNYAMYHDRYQRTTVGWKFAERVYEGIYINTTQLVRSVPRAIEVSAYPAGQGQIFDERHLISI